MAACACFASSTGSPDRPVSLNSMPIGARVERIGVQATQPRPTTRVSPLWCSTIGQFSNTVKCAPSSSDAPERLAIGLADVVHDVVLVDDRAA